MLMRTSSVEHWQAFGVLLKSLRQSRSWGLRPFARAVGIAPSYQAFIESGHVPPPSEEKILRMAEVLDVPAQRLLIPAGRLPSDVLRALWQHPAMPAILSTLPGMSLDEAQTFCRQVIGSLPSSTPA
jgi:HTH-type transcriptional regulator, competence development regulator